MKTLTQRAYSEEIFRRVNKFILAAGILICVTAGWCLGNITTQVYSQSNKQKDFAEIENRIILHSIPINGKSLPTIMLKEVSVLANKR